MDIERLKALAMRSRDNFIAKRTQIETEISKLAENLRQLSPETKEKLMLNLDDITAEKCFPALYKDIYREEEYEADLKRFRSEILDKIVAVRTIVYQEAEGAINAAEKLYNRA